MEKDPPRTEQDVSSRDMVSMMLAASSRSMTETQQEAEARILASGLRIPMPSTPRPFALTGILGMHGDDDAIRQRLHKALSSFGTRGVDWSMAVIMDQGGGHCISLHQGELDAPPVAMMERAIETLQAMPPRWEPLLKEMTQDRVMVEVFLPYRMPGKGSKGLKQMLTLYPQAEGRSLEERVELAWLRSFPLSLMGEEEAAIWFGHTWLAHPTAWHTVSGAEYAHAALRKYPWLLDPELVGRWEIAFQPYAKPPGHVEREETDAWRRHELIGDPNADMQRAILASMATAGEWVDPPKPLDPSVHPLWAKHRPGMAYDVSPKGCPWCSDPYPDDFEGVLQAMPCECLGYCATCWALVEKRDECRTNCFRCEKACHYRNLLTEDRVT